MIAPFLLLTSALTIGILVGRYFGSWWLSITLFIGGIALYLYFLHRSKTIKGMLKVVDKHWIWVAMMACSVGISTELIHKPQEYDFENEIYPPFAQGVVVESHQLSESSQLIVDITGLFDSKNFYKTERTRVALYTEGKNFDVGSEVVFIHHLRRIKDSGNYQRDFFAQYMRRKGILYSQSVSDDDINSYGRAVNLSVLAAEYRDWCVVRLEKSSLSSQARNFLMAILLGYRDNLAPEDKMEFQQAGLSHIMALSGLHIGIIAGILTLILFPLNFFCSRKLRWCLVVVLLWVFTFFTGLSPSALRATIMATFMYGGLILERKRSMVNSLFAAAFLILLLSPEAIFNAGFLLSFAAAFIIAYFSQRVNPIKRHEHPRTYYLYSLVLVSIIAFLSTLPLVVYYFHTFPIASLPCNMLIALLFPFYLAICLMYSILVFMGCDSTMLAYVVEQGYQWLGTFSSWVNSFAISNVRLWLPGAVVALIYAGYAIIALRFRYKSAYLSYMLIGVGVLIISGMVFLPDEFPEDGFIVQNSNNAAIRIYANGKEELLELPQGKVKLYEICGKKIAWIDNVVDNISLSCDYIVIGNGFNKKLSDFNGHINAAQYICLKNVYPSRSEEWKSEANALGLPYYSIRENGAYKFTDSQINKKY